MGDVPVNVLERLGLGGIDASRSGLLLGLDIRADRHGGASIQVEASPALGLTGGALGVALGDDGNHLLGGVRDRLGVGLPLLVRGRVLALASALLISRPHGLLISDRGGREVRQRRRENVTGDGLRGLRSRKPEGLCIALLRCLRHDVSFLHG